MQTSDFIILTVTGRNPETRGTIDVLERFNGQGLVVDGSGNTVSGKNGLKLALGGSKAPEFPVQEYEAARQAGDKEKMNQLMVASAERLSAWQQQAGGGSEQLQLVRAAIQWLVEEKGFLTTDGNGFVIKEDNLDVTSQVNKEGRTIYTIAGTAVFGH